MRSGDRDQVSDRPTVRPLVAALVALGLAAGGCSGEDASPPASPANSSATPSASAEAADAPVLGASHALLPDPVGRGVLLLSGPPEGTVDDGPMTLWRWDGATWAMVETPGPGPSARNFFSATYDQRRGVVVVFGGDTASGASDETWEWDGRAWTSFDATGPGALMSASLIFDPTSGANVLYGGNDDAGATRSETWAWDGSSWSRLARPGPTPTRGRPRWSRIRATAPWSCTARHQVADERLPPALGDTWEWDRRTWVSRGDASGPGDLVNAGAMVHPRLGTLLVGGSDMDRPSGDVWVWGGDRWRIVAKRVFPPRQAFGLAYDEVRDTVVLTGGVVQPGSVERHQDVWEWSGRPEERAVQVDSRSPA